VLQETDQVAFAFFSRMEGMHEPLSSHLGALWSGSLGHVPAPIRREQDRYWARALLGRVSAMSATHGELKHSRLNIVNEEDERGKAKLFTRLTCCD
jgi:hypothetical protein